MDGGRFMVVGSLRVGVSDHALERWRERCRPGLDLDGALRDLFAVAQGCGMVVRVAPSWVRHDRESVGDAPGGWLVIGEVVAFPLDFDGRGWRSAKTCIVPGIISDAARAERQARRRVQSAARAVRRREGMSTHSRAAARRKQPGPSGRDVRQIRRDADRG